MGFKLKPFADQVVIRPIVEDDVTPGGILLIESAKETPTRGEVLAVGPGRHAPDTGALIKPVVQVGMIVIFKKYGGTDVTVDGVDLKILPESKLLTAIEEDAAVEAEAVAAS